MRFIGKKSVCGAALGLLLAFYLIRKRKAQGGHAADDNVSADYQSTDAPPVVAPESDTPSVSDSSDAGPNDASATNAAVPNEPTPSAPPDGAETSTHRKDFSEAAHTASLSSTTLDTPAPGAPPAVDSDARTNDSSDTEIDDVSAANPDISVYEKALDTQPSPSETPSDSDNEGMLDTPPNAVKPRKPRRTPQVSQSGQAQTRRRQAGTYPRMHRGRRVPTGAYYPRNSLPIEVAKLRCRETSDGWEMFVALPEGRQAVEAFHNKDELDLDDEIRLDRFDGAVFVRYEDDTVDRIQLADASMDSPLFFRMRRNWEGKGRLVGKPSAGYIVAIAPRDYVDEWDDVEAAIEPEDCVDRNFQARFLFLKGTPPGAITQMRLEGTTLCDDSDIAHHGKLYIGAPPKLSVDPQIGAAVIVEETGVRADNKWVQDFQPHNQSIASALDGREGRFSVRTYQDGTRHETRTFRYFPSLRHITIDGNPHTENIAAFPDKGDGTHRAIELQFVSNGGGLLRPTSATATSAGVDEPGELQIAGAGIVTVPPLPSIQAVKCEFPNRASIALAMPRVWWRKTDENGAGGDWSGALFSIPRNEFASLLKTRLEIKMPPWVRTVFMGFGDKTDSEVPAIQGKASVELIAFANVEELEGTLEEDLFLNIRINGQSAPIVRVLADPVSYADGDYHLIEIRRTADDSLVCLARRSVDVKEGDIYKVKTRKGKGAVIDGMVDKIRPQSIKNNPKVIDVTI